MGTISRLIARENMWKEIAEEAEYQADIAREEALKEAANLADEMEAGVRNHPVGIGAAIRALIENKSKKGS